MMRKLELLSPAANAEIAKAAILHGADAVYIGPPNHGARKSAANSIEDIAGVVDFAHIFRAKVYVTVNTVICEDELKNVERMIWDLWRVGVDAIIVQDMGILRMNLPPIALHASTQCDTRTPEKALFLQQVGFSQIVLARELTLTQIREICSAVKVPIECFVHGALCVSYSGVCHASQSCFGRSANRGECAQLCRLPYQLVDSKDKKISEGHLLSLKDFNLLDSLDQLIDAGVSSFKIEGRLKEIGYVKNVTSAYSRKLNEIITVKNRESERRIEFGKFQCSRELELKRSSIGEVEYKFEPNVFKSFNRGFTHYFLNNRKPSKISEIRTPKSLGEKIDRIQELNPGDGISWFDDDGHYTGMIVNKISDRDVWGPRGMKLPRGKMIYRTSDVKWGSQMAKESAIRKIPVDINIDDTGITSYDARGVRVRIPLPEIRMTAEKPMSLLPVFSKLGTTSYKLRLFEQALNKEVFIPASVMTEARRKLVAELDKANVTTYPIEKRREEEDGVPFLQSEMDYTGNISNSLAEEFYREHGVVKIERAAELMDKREMTGKQVMLTRHCILRESGLCKKKAGATKLSEPLFLVNGNGIRFRLGFDCKACEMQLFKA